MPAGGRARMRILINMPSQYGGKASGVARVTFSLLERLLEQTTDDYVLRSPGCGRNCLKTYATAGCSSSRPHGRASWFSMWCVRP